MKCYPSQAVFTPHNACLLSFIAFFLSCRAVYIHKGRGAKIARQTGQKWELTFSVNGRVTMRSGVRPLI